MKRTALDSIVKSFSRKLKTTWQVVFLPSVLVYIMSLFHLFYVKPASNESVRPFAKNLDLISYIIAIVLTLAIFNLKRKYFSRKFSRQIVENSLRTNPELDDESLLKRVFAIIQKKMLFVWLLGVLVILDGVLYYWITFSPLNNIHIYFVIGAFSLVLNYPRSELFSDLPWYVIEGRKAFRDQ